jgi:TPR repeat protein
VRRLVMRILAGVLVVFTTILLPNQQVATKPVCELQDLAIDAALGDPEAQYNLGVEFHRGKAITQDFSKAAKMWRLACEAGIIEAYNNLGYLNYNGKGIKQDYAEGVRLWRKAAEQGFVESQVHLGFAYTDKKHLQVDYAEAYAWGKTAIYYATQIKDEEMLQRARRLVRQSTEELSGIEKSQADKKASEYIKKYGPK